jgi:uncharacterized protein
MRLGAESQSEGGYRDGVAQPPIPVADELSAGFWEAAARGVLAMQRCSPCGTLAYPPGRVCSSCVADPPVFEWAQVSGDGRLATWTIVRDAFLPAFAAETPYVVGEVELAEQPGLRVVARVVGVDDADLRIGLPLRVEFAERGIDDAGAPVRVPVFVPVVVEAGP